MEKALKQDQEKLDALMTGTENFLRELAEKLYNRRRDLRHVREQRTVYGQYLTWEKLDEGDREDWIEMARFAVEQVEGRR